MPNPIVPYEPIKNPETPVGHKNSKKKGGDKEPQSTKKSGKKVESTPTNQKSAKKKTTKHANTPAAI